MLWVEEKRKGILAKAIIYVFHRGTIRTWLVSRISRISMC
jgi:hypothetical protein